MARIESDLLNYSSSYMDGDVLKNKLNIKDSKKLEIAERIITTRKLALLYNVDVTNVNFDAAYYMNIHKFLFEDIYPFAGDPRTESIQKTILFAPPPFIYGNLVETLQKAKRIAKSVISREDLLDFIVFLHSELDVIHPFREGNGRTNREFIRQYMKHICLVNGLEDYYLDYSKIEDRNLYINAVIKADALLEYDDLKKLFDSIMVSSYDNELTNKHV